jgi:predicted NBD/HSP70 family sugar kinase
VLGVDVGVHKVLALLSDLSGEVVHSERRTVAADADPRHRLAALDRVIKQTLAATGKSPADIWAVTVGVTGPVDASGRTSLFTPIPGWEQVDLPAHLAGTFTCPVIVENDCKLAALAERWKGAASDADDVVYVLAGMRIGAGLIIDGVLRRGHGGAAGEIGALKHVRWLAAPSHLENCPGVPDSVSADDAAAWVFEAARRGDKNAKTAVNRYVKDLAVGAAALVLTLDPLSRELQRLCLRVPEVRASTLGADSVALGAVRLALNEVDERLFNSTLSAPSAPRRSASS